MSTLASVVLRDTLANRPTPGMAGRLFFASDAGVTYRDNGASWDVWSASIILRRESATQPDGIATVFIFTGLAYSADAIQVFLGGLLQDPDNDDCAISFGGGNTIVTFPLAPAEGERLLAYF